MRYYFLCFTLCLLLQESIAQSYTSYFTGNTTNISPQVQGGVCLMGGATENDNAMRWFLQRANGGDVIVIRTSGSDGYNDYFYTTLGININSVETIVFNNASAASDIYVQTRIANAEAIWIAGGDQWEYVSYWKDNAIEEIINHSIRTKNIVIGGISAGMAIQGSLYFNAQNGTVSSAQALNNPYDNNVTLGKNDFLEVPFMRHVITDTHYDNPDRQGRHTTFLARMLQDWGISAKGIACDEYTAVCIEPDGTAKVYGDYPTYNDFAYFIQSNCTKPITPERCQANQTLNWNRNNAALKTYKIAGTPNGTNTFNLFDWKTGSGGVWENWWVENGTLNTSIGTSPSCPEVEVRMRVFLQGAYLSGNGLMSDNLRSYNLLPLLEPYHELGILSAETKAMTNPNVLATNGNNAIVDWVLVELRDKNDSSLILAQQAALLQRDGDIVGTDGNSAVRFAMPPDTYYIAIRHRNHLAVMTKTAINL